GWKKNVTPVHNLREQVPRNPPSILLPISMVGDAETMAPDPALICSPAASSTRTIGKAPGYKISLFISLVSLSHPPVQPVTWLRPFFQIAHPDLSEIVFGHL